MWVEAILQGQDLSQLAAQLLPVTIHLDEGMLSLSEPREVTLLPDVGLRIACAARIHWPVLGIEVPLALHALRFVLRPEIAKGPNATATLVFKLEIEHMDLAGIPTCIDNRITALVNAALVAKHTEMAWNFVKTLSHVFSLPASLQPVEALDLGVSDARVKVTEQAMGLAILFKFDVIRQDARAARPRETTSNAAPADEIRTRSVPPRQHTLRLLRQSGAAAVVGALSALSAVGVYALIRGKR